MESMHFEEAMVHLRDGKKLTRASWQDPAVWVQIVEPKEGDKLKTPFIHKNTGLNNRIPWTALQADLLADDWELVGAPAAV